MRATIEDGTVVLVGRLDVRGAPAARDALQAALTGGTGQLVVDLAGVELLDATGLGVLVGAHRRARLQDRQLVLRDVTPRVARLLAMTRLDRVIPVRTGSEACSA